MPIDVRWENERGENWTVYDGPLIGLHILQAAPQDTVCIRFIDPYGETIFNRDQIEVLESELMALRNSEDPETAAQVEALLKFIGQRRDRIHWYLRFSGD